MRPAGRSRLVVPAIAAVVVTAAGCRCGDAALAELTARTGTVERGRAQGSASWRGAAIGDRFELGDAVRTLRGGTARLHIEAGGVLRMAEETVVRFLPGHPGGAALGLGVDTGIAEIESTGDVLTFDTELGTARIEGHGRVRLRAGANERPRLEVLVGTARLETEDGPVALRAGQSVGAEPAIDANAQVSAPAPPPAPPPLARADDGGVAGADGNAGAGSETASGPRRPPRNLVDADGRRYSVLYQTVLPILTMRWPGTSAPGPYTVTVQATSGSRRVRATALPKHTFASGALDEGSYRFWFKAADGSRSPESTLQISRRGQPVH